MIYELKQRILPSVFFILLLALQLGAQVTTGPQPPRTGCDSALAYVPDPQDRMNWVMSRLSYCGDRGFQAIASIVRQSRAFDRDRQLEMIELTTRTVSPEVHESLIERAEDANQPDDLRIRYLWAAMITGGTFDIWVSSADERSRGMRDCPRDMPHAARGFKEVPRDVHMRSLHRVRSIRDAPATGAELRAFANCALYYLHAVTGAPYPFDASKITARHVCGNEFLVRNDNEGTVGLTYDLDGGTNPGVVTLAAAREGIARKISPGPMRLFYKDQLILEVARTGGSCPPRSPSPYAEMLN